jgi:hypothetical protein
MHKSVDQDGDEVTLELECGQHGNTNIDYVIHRTLYLECGCWWSAVRKDDLKFVPHGTP